MITRKPLAEGPLYAFPTFGLLALTIAGTALGIARAAIDDLLDLAGGKVPTGSARSLAERPVTQASIAQAEATLLSAAFREDAQPEVGVKVAAGEAFRRAVADASPFRLEPIMSVEVVVPEEYLGAVIGDLKQRRANIYDLGSGHDRRMAQAHVPLRQMFGYSTDLRSLTKGRATFTMEFHAFDNLIEGQPA